MPLGYLDDASVVDPLYPLILLCDYPSEHNVIQFEWVLHCDNLVLQPLIGLSELPVQHGVTKQPAPRLSHIGDHRVITDRGNREQEGLGIKKSHNRGGYSEEPQVRLASHLVKV